MDDRKEKPARTSPFLRKRAHKLADGGDSEKKRSLFLDEDDQPKRGVFLLPNLITAAGLFCGFWSITESFAAHLGGAAAAHHFVTAAWLIIAAMLFDGADGKIARWTHTSSAFGIEFDSLADLVSFGVAPGVLAFSWALHDTWNPKIGWTFATIFVMCGALRLARFNVQFDPAEKTYMTGLAIPAAASGVALSVLFFTTMGWVTETGRSIAPNLFLVLVVVISFLMISRFKYLSFKNIDMVKRRPFSTFLLLVIFVVVIARWPEETLFILFLIYMVSGPAMHFHRRFTGRHTAEEASIID